MPRPLRGDFAKSSTVVLAAIGVWWLVTAVVLRDPRIFPTPPAVAEALGRIILGDSPIGSSTYSNAWASLERVLIAFGVAYGVGTLTGVVAGRVRAVFDFFSNLAWIAFAVPSVVWAFIFLVIFGLGNLVPVTALTVLLSAPVFIGTTEGIRRTPDDLIAMTQAFRVRWVDRLIHVYLPSILPMMLANARIALALGFKIVIIAEVVGLKEGVGLLVRYWFDSTYMAPVIAWAVIFIVVGLVVDRLALGYLERKVALWYGRPSGDN